MTIQSRREVLKLLTAAAFVPTACAASPMRSPPGSRRFRIRTITAGVPLSDPGNLAPVESALAALARGKAIFLDEGYEVQTVRVATTPFLAGLPVRDRDRLLPVLRTLDTLVATQDSFVSVGPVLTTDTDDEGLADWVAELLHTTSRLNVSVVVASPDAGTHPRAAIVAARTMAAVARATSSGVGNFRFAATACIPAGTPFFPVAYHEGQESLALGLETASLVEEALTGAASARDATRRLQTVLNAALAPAERIALRFAQAERRRYLGIDPSPAPGLDRSIGAALEALIHGPFGMASTLDACAAVTAALKTLTVRTCGYAGLMLPVLEDPRLAQRATEGRFSVRDLLLYSSVCGTGLDVVPLPGDTPVATLAKIVLDVAALSAKLQKPLSARLFPVPGKGPGDHTAFTDPLLTNCAVFPVA